MLFTGKVPFSMHCQDEFDPVEAVLHPGWHGVHDPCPKSVE
jgi:hypothetical protein